MSFSSDLRHRAAALGNRTAITSCLGVLLVAHCLYTARSASDGPRTDALAAEVPSTEDPPCGAAWHALASGSDKEFACAFARLVAERRECAQRVLAVAQASLQPTLDSERFKTAVALIPEYCPREGLAFLGENVHVRVPARVWGTSSVLRDYPCAKALCEIGPSAVPQILLQLEMRRAPTARERSVLARTILEIYGGEHGDEEEAFRVVERAIRRAHPNHGRENLQDVLESMKRIGEQEKSPSNPPAATVD